MSFFKKHKVLTRILIGILIFVLVVVGLAVWFISSKLNKINYDDGKKVGEISDIITDYDENGEGEENILTEEDIKNLENTSAIPATSEIFADSDVFNILLLGTDERTPEFNVDARADSIMLLSINKEDESIKLVSLERGMGVPILEGQYAGQYDWLTHCFRYGGADLMIKEVRECFRIDVNRYVRVNFNTFSQIVDSVGGVDISLTSAEAKALGLSEGMNHLDGRNALAYSRLRKIDSDWQRIGRQRNVLQSALKAAKGMSLLEINDAADTILPLIQTNLTKGEILDLIWFAPNILGKDIEQMTIPQEGTYGGMKGMGGRSLFAVDFETNAQILREFFYGIQE